jgi:hypothetical protein
MPDARDTELLKYIRSYGQSEASPPPCEFEHWGASVVLSPELAKQFEPPADPLAFAEFMEEMLLHCRRFMSGYPGTRSEDHEKVLQAFTDHFLTPSKDNPIPNFRRYGHKGRAQPYGVWFLKCFCNFLKERYPVSNKAREVPMLPPPSAINPFGPHTPASSSPQTLSNVVPLQPAPPLVVPKWPTMEPPQPSRENPFHQPAANRPPTIKLGLNLGENRQTHPRRQFS